jgi:hypothetical protein
VGRRAENPTPGGFATALIKTATTYGCIQATNSGFARSSFPSPSSPLPRYVATRTGLRLSLSPPPLPRSSSPRPIVRFYVYASTHTTCNNMCNRFMPFFLSFFFLFFFFLRISTYILFTCRARAVCARGAVAILFLLSPPPPPRPSPPPAQAGETGGQIPESACSRHYIRTRVIPHA